MKLCNQTGRFVGGPSPVNWGGGRLGAAWSAPATAPAALPRAREVEDERREDVPPPAELPNTVVMPCRRHDDDCLPLDHTPAATGLDLNMHDAFLPVSG